MLNLGADCCLIYHHHLGLSCGLRESTHIAHSNLRCGDKCGQVAMSSVSAASGWVSIAFLSALITLCCGLISRMAWFREPILGSRGEMPLCNDPGEKTTALAFRTCCSIESLRVAPRSSTSAIHEDTGSGFPGQETRKHCLTPMTWSLVSSSHTSKRKQLTPGFQFKASNVGLLLSRPVPARLTASKRLGLHVPLHHR